eukprot:PhM_4_TR3222/c0_g2_i1/m.67766
MSLHSLWLSGAPNICAQNHVTLNYSAISPSSTPTTTSTIHCAFETATSTPTTTTNNNTRMPSYTKESLLASVNNSAVKNSNSNNSTSSPTTSARRPRRASVFDFPIVTEKAERDDDKASMLYSNNSNNNPSSPMLTVASPAPSQALIPIGSPNHTTEYLPPQQQQQQLQLQIPSNTSMVNVDSNNNNTNINEQQMRLIHRNEQLDEDDLRDLLVPYSSCPPSTSMLTFIDVSGNKLLCDEGVQELCQHLPRLPNVQTLLLRRIKMTDEGLVMLERAVMSHPSLSLVDVSENRLHALVGETSKMIRKINGGVVNVICDHNRAQEKKCIVC